TSEGPGNSGSFAYTVERRDRNLYLSSLLNGDAENWFGNVISTKAAPETLTISHLDPNATDQAVIEVALQGVSGSAHQVNVMLNGTLLQGMNFNGMDHTVLQIPVPQGLLVEGANQVSFAAQNGGDVSLVDYVKITYAHTYQAENNSLFGTVSGN